MFTVEATPVRFGPGAALETGRGKGATVHATDASKTDFTSPHKPPPRLKQT